MNMWRSFLVERSVEQELVIQAASSGDLESLKALEPELQKWGVRAVATCYAAQHGHAGIIQYLYSTVSADAELRPWSFGDHAVWPSDGPQMTSSPLHIAVKEGHLDVVKEILHFLQKSRLHEKCISKKHELFVWFQGLVEWAVRWGDAPIVQLLLTPPMLVPLPHESSEKLSLPLHLAAYYNHLDVLNLLLQTCRHHSPHFSHPDFSADGLTPLHIAAHSGSLSAVQLLLSKANLDVNARSRPEFFTPLHMAANAGHVDVVSLLLQSFTKHDQLAEAVSMSRRRLDLTARDCMGRTALHYAVREGHEDVVQKLLDGANQMQGNMGPSFASLVDHDGLLPLHMAARAGHVGLLKKLRSSYGEGINRRARHSVHMKTRVEMEYMQQIERQANMYYGERWAFPRPRLVDSFFWKTGGFSPLQFAARYGHEAAMRELQLRTEKNINASEASSLILLNNVEEYGLKLAEAASEIEEEEKAMAELVHAWDKGLPPPLKTHIVRWLEDEDIGSVRIYWLQKAAETCNWGLLKRLLEVSAEFQATESDQKNVEYILADCSGAVHAQNDCVRKGLMGAFLLLLLQPLTTTQFREVALQALDNVLREKHYEAAKGIVLQVPEVALVDDSLAATVVSRWHSYDWSESASFPLMDFLMAVVTRKGLVGVPPLLHALNSLTEMNALPGDMKAYNRKMQLLTELLLLHQPGVTRDTAFDVLESALRLRSRNNTYGLYGAAREIVLNVPQVALVDNRLAKCVQAHLDSWKTDKQMWPSYKNVIFDVSGFQDFLMAVVTRDGLVGASSLLRALLPWTKECVGFEDLVQVILDRPELKSGLYEDRQVYLDCANAILVGAALIAGVAFQGWLQPPLGYNYPYEGGEYAELQKPLVRTFWRFNNGAFFLAVGALIAGAKGAVPMARDTNITESVEKVKRAVAVASTLLGMALVCVVVAFTTAGFVVLPPLPADLRMMRRSVAWGATTCGLALLWFYRSVLPLLGYYIRLAHLVVSCLLYIYLVCCYV